MVKAGHSPSVRLFEAAACATPIISDRWPGLETIFADRRSIRLASTTRDVVRILGMRAPERIGAAAHEVIARGHSAAHRAAELEAYLHEVSAASVIPTSAGAAS
jgi:spore maturation protein CgeB